MEDNQDASTQDELIEHMQAHAEALQNALQIGDMEAASQVLQEINQARDSLLYREVGKLTRELHSAIRNFNIDTSSHLLSEQQRSEMADAQDNLSYVIKLTQQSADKTMDMVEEGIPVVAEMSETAAQLRDDWHRFHRREMSKKEFAELANKLTTFLDKSVVDSQGLSDKLNTILLAQDFQDLTGQVLKRVIDLVQEVEASLVQLMRIAGQVDQITGQKHPENETPVKQKSGIEAEGPIVNPEMRDNVVTNQDDVDDLLSSLGF